MLIEKLFSVHGKRVLVTGGSSGIGFMIAQAFVENGATVAINGRNSEKCKAAADALGEHGQCRAVPADITTQAGREQLVEFVTGQFDGLDVLVNNAGVARNVDFEAFEDDDYSSVLDANLKAPFFLTAALMPTLRASATSDDPARIINVGSNDGLRVPTPRQHGYAYGASKAAVHHLTRILALRYGPEHITVNAIAPGPFPSEMMTGILERHQRQIEEACPLGRIGRPTDMAGVAIYLASLAGAYVTGVVIPVDGGNTLA